MYDVIVIGGGAAGLSAAITLRQRNKTVCILRPVKNVSSVLKAERVDNYLGMPFIRGRDMHGVFEKQALDMGTELIAGTATNILHSGDTFFVSFGAEFIEGGKIILATGVKQPKLIKGEADFIGRGVSYCGTCDGMLFRGKTIAVAAENDEAEEETAFLASLAKKIYLTGRIPADLPENVEIIDGIDEIAGDGEAERVFSGERIIGVDGIFIFRDCVAYSYLLPGLEFDGRYVKVNRQMETNIPGVYAAGDCTGGPFQIAKAVGEGNVAALSAASEMVHLASRASEQTPE